MDLAIGTLTGLGQPDCYGGLNLQNNSQPQF